MKKLIFLITIAIEFTIAQAGEPVYDDLNRCNISGSTLAPGVYVAAGACEQTGFVCKLASDPTGSVFFWLGTSSDCKNFHTTHIPTYFPKQDGSGEIDTSNPNHQLRLTLSPGADNANALGTAIMASQILSAKIDKAQVSVIYTSVPDGQFSSLNSIRLLSISRVD